MEDMNGNTVGTFAFTEGSDMEGIKHIANELFDALCEAQQAMLATADSELVAIAVRHSYLLERVECAVKDK